MRHRLAAEGAEEALEVGQGGEGEEGLGGVGEHQLDGAVLQQVPPPVHLLRVFLVWVLYWGQCRGGKEGGEASERVALP